MASDNEYMRAYMAERYERRKARAIELLGGRCVRCGLSDDLEFDHIVPSTKLFSICDRIAGVSESQLFIELRKCQLLCTPCHRDKSRDEGSLGNDAVEYECCGRTFVGRKAYAGHRCWCTQAPMR